MTSRILIVDDTPSIHEDFHKILKISNETGRLDELASDLFGETAQNDIYEHLNYQVDSAYQGEEALSMIELAETENRGYDLVFMDVRMPPGMDGIKTIARIWDKYPRLEIVICTAYSDYSWVDIIRMLGPSDQLLVLKKPFDADEAQQMALALTRKAKKSSELQQHLDSTRSALAECNKNVLYLKQIAGTHDHPEQ